MLKQFSTTVRLKASPDFVYRYLTDPYCALELVKRVGQVEACNVNHKIDGGYSYDSIQTHFLIAVRNHLETGQLVPNERVEVISKGDFATLTTWELSPAPEGGTFALLRLEFDTASSVLTRLTAPIMDSTARQALKDLSTAAEALIFEQD